MKQILIAMIMIHCVVPAVPAIAAASERRDSAGACIESFCAPARAADAVPPEKSAGGSDTRLRHTLLMLLGIGLFCQVILLRHYGRDYSVKYR